MSDFNCRGFNCNLFAVVASIIIGVVAAFLTITATIEITAISLYVVFGIAVAYLALAFYTFIKNREIRSRCLCNGINILLAGILGSILTAIILLAIPFAATSVIGAIITGLLLFFFSLIFTITACIIRCVTNCEREN